VVESCLEYRIGSGHTNASTNGRSKCDTHGGAGCMASSVEKRGRSRRRCCRILCRLDSRQAAAKRADRDRRATHAPQCSPSEDRLFFADGVSLQSQCAIDAAGNLIRSAQ
jgi:hypothetical protein